MYVDKHAEFSDAQAVTTTAISTNVIDLVANTSGKNPVRDIGQGQPLYLVVLSNKAATAAGAATVTVELVSAENEALTTGKVVHVATAALPIAAMSGAGKVLYMGAIPADDYKRYLGVSYTVATGPLTAGAFDAFLTSDITRWKAYQAS